MSEITIPHPYVQRAGYVWVEFKGHRREVFANPFEFPFRCGDVAIVEADRGQDAGIVRFVFSAVRHPEAYKPEHSVVRKAGTQDLERIAWLRELEKTSLSTCASRIEHHKLPMHLVDAEYRFDGAKLTFFFTAESRVDFRELVRDLAGTFHTRIELRQIGARDEFKRWDGYGVCGRRLCCISFLNNFQPITTHMAKAQHLILNPSKLSGVCARLKCCLGFEVPNYEQREESSSEVELSEAEDTLDDIEQLSD